MLNYPICKTKTDPKILQFCIYCTMYLIIYMSEWKAEMYKTSLLTLLPFWGTIYRVDVRKTQHSDVGCHGQTYDAATVSFSAFLSKHIFSIFVYTVNYSVVDDGIVANEQIKITNLPPTPLWSPHCALINDFLENLSLVLLSAVCVCAWYVMTCYANLTNDHQIQQIQNRDRPNFQSLLLSIT